MDADVKKSINVWRDVWKEIDILHDGHLSGSSGNDLVRVPWRRIQASTWNHIWQYSQRRASPRRDKNTGALAVRPSRSQNHGHVVERLKHMWALSASHLSSRALEKRSRAFWRSAFHSSASFGALEKLCRTNCNLDGWCSRVRREEPADGGVAVIVAEEGGTSSMSPSYNH